MHAKTIWFIWGAVKAQKHYIWGAMGTKGELTVAVNRRWILTSHKHGEMPIPLLEAHWIDETNLIVKFNTLFSGSSYIILYPSAYGT